MAASLTLLQIVQNACDEIGVSRPSAVYSNTDDQVRTLLAMSNREGRDLVRMADWTVLQRLHSFTTTSSTAEYDLPSDYERLIGETEWDQAERRPMLGPTSPQVWREIKSSLVGSGIVGRRFRIFRASSGTGRKIYVDPTPSVNGDTLSFEYVSSNWLSNAGGSSTYSSWQADTDICLLDGDLMTLGLIVRWKRSKGFDFASEADEYDQLAQSLKGTDRPAKVLRMDNVPGTPLLGPWNLPETGLTG